MGHWSTASKGKPYVLESIDGKTLIIRKKSQRKATVFLEANNEWPLSVVEGAMVEVRIKMVDSGTGFAYCVATGIPEVTSDHDELQFA